MLKSRDRAIAALVSVSNDSVGNGAKPAPDWKAVRYEYETTEISQRKLADKHGISRNTLMQRAMREKWSQPGKMVQRAASKLKASINEKMIAKVQDQLAPYIEREKVKITKRGIRLGNHGLTRIERLWKSQHPTIAKAEADGARAAETFLRMARTSLGMSDGSAAAGPVNVNILTNRSAVQVVSNDCKPE